jgi:hypothetical protein
MTYPLIAFALWLLSTDALPAGNPADQFITVTGVTDQPTQNLLRMVGQKIATDSALQSSLADGQKGFTGWLGYFGSEDVAAYPKNCRVYPSQVKAIASLPSGTRPAAKRALAAKARMSEVPPPTPYPGIALALLSMSAPSLDDHANICNAYMCEEACSTDVYLQLLFYGLKHPDLQASVAPIRSFYQQYLQVLKDQSVDINSYPGGWTCAIKNNLHADALDSLRNRR